MQGWLSFIVCALGFDAYCLMHGEGTRDPFDIMVGEMRRPMLIASVEEAIREIEKE